MNTGRYVLVLLQHAVLIAAVAVLAAGLSVSLGRGQAPVYTSSTTFLVTPVDVGEGASIGSISPAARITLPSLARVAESGQVLTDAEDRLGLPSGSLTGAVTAAVPRRQTFLQLSVTGPDPAAARARADAVNESLRRTARALTGDSISLDVVTPPREPRFASSTGNRTRAMVGGLAGAAAASLLVGLVEAARPRFRSRRDGIAPRAPALVLPRRVFRTRTTDVDRLTERLTWLVPATDARRVAQLAGAPVRRGAATTVHATGAGDVLVVRSGRATLAEVESLSARAAAVVLVAGATARWADATAERVRHVLGDRRSDRRRAFAGVVPAAVLVLVGFDPPLPAALNATALVTVALVPVWIRHVPGFRGAPVLMALGAVALASGTVLAMTSGADHEWSRPEATGQVLLVVGAIGTIGVVCWARDVMPVWGIPLSFGAGMLVAAFPGLGSTVNPVKFLLVFPLSLVVLSLCDAWGRRWPAVLACGGLAVLVVVNDGRSTMSFLVATAAILVWQASRTGRRSLNRAGTVVAVLGAGTAGYFLLSDLLLSGALGDEVAERSRAQVEQSGSLLLGGRPEWSGTLQLMSDRFTGFGLGTVPNGSDVSTIKQGFESLRVPTATGYIENYLTGGRFELHSVIADLWVWLGLPGLALGLLALGLVVWGLVDRLASARAPSVVVYLGLTAVWLLAFGPLPSNIPEVSVAIGLCLVPAGRRRVPGQPAGSRSSVQPVVRGQSTIPVGEVGLHLGDGPGAPEGADHGRGDGRLVAVDR